MSFENITFENQEGIVFIGFGKTSTKSMTTLTQGTLEELKSAVLKVKELSQSKEAKGLVFFSHKAGVFLAGVEIDIISSLNTETQAKAGAEAGQEIYNIIEDLPIPTAAAVDGVCLGGGLELALSCKFIIASDNPKTALGLPEVRLGVLPGFGGTYRLPKRVGLPAALDMILAGKQIRSHKAKKMGLVDMVMPKERLLEKASEYLFMSEEEISLKDSIENFATDNFISRKVIFQKARENVLKMTKGHYPAPLKILDLMEIGHGKKRSSYLSMEAEAFAELSQTEQSKNLLHIFFLTDASKKLEGKKDLKKVKRGAVLGAGTMGGGIAWLFAENGQNPFMKDINLSGLELGLKQASKNFNEALKRKRITKDEFNRKMRSIIPTTKYDGFKSVDLVIEAVVENMEIKKKVFSEMEKQVSVDSLITSNTSSLSVTEMATSLEKPERFAGLHFFNPVHKMPLVEIIKHDKVSEETIKSLYKWCLDVKKTPIIVGDGPGFLVNRILMPFINESAYLLAEGVPLKDLDRAVLNFGMPMGPGRLMDEVGIDVLVKVGKVMEEGLGKRAKACDISAKATEAGLLGKKTSKGFYLYDERGKSIEENPEMENILPKDKIKMDERTIQMRVILPMINEAANILKDGIVDKAEIVDLGLVYGIGFPPFRGGLLKYADNEGLDRITKAIIDMSSTVDADRYALSPFLKDLNDNHKKFYDI